LGIESSPNRFVLLKTREAVDRYLEIVRSLSPRRVVELGIFRGGSTALLMELAQPAMLMAIECEPEPVAALETYLTRTGFRDTCRTHYGVDQADRERVARLIDASFGTAPLDMVIDDASHLGPQTRASFETLFPRLRPRGLYVIEDWSWHLQGLDLRGESMDGFVSDLLAAAGRGPGLIAAIELVWDVIVVWRGAAPVDPGTFAVADWFEQML
jgi:predicted O-methyltransferase YrrM